MELVGGNSANEGRVVLTRNGISGTVCDDNFDQQDAQVICNMLGYQ